MTEEELAAFATWLRHTQGVEIEPERLREPAGAAAALAQSRRGQAELRVGLLVEPARRAIAGLVRGARHVVARAQQIAHPAEAPGVGILAR